MILIGAGGHAKMLIEAQKFDSYCDPQLQIWTKLPRSLHEAGDCVVGFVGLTVDALHKRLKKVIELKADKTIIHPKAIVSPFALIESAVQVLPGAIVNADAKIKRGAIINTGAIIEHDVEIGQGTHIAPGAIVLGGAKIGECCFIGAGAIVIQGSIIPDYTFVKAGSIWK